MLLIELNFEFILIFPPFIFKFCESIPTNTLSIFKLPPLIIISPCTLPLLSQSIPYSKVDDKLLPGDMFKFPLSNVKVPFSSIKIEAPFAIVFPPELYIVSYVATFPFKVNEAVSFPLIVKLLPFTPINRI